MSTVQRGQNKVSRRSFLRRAACGALALGPAVVCPAFAQEAGDPASMAIARWADAMDAGDIPGIASRLTERAIEAVGGMKRFVNRGDVVWIKPNIGFHLGPEFAVNTNPDVVATLVRLCLDAGAKQVKVGDNSCYGAERAYPISGIEAAVQAVGGEMVYLQPDRFREMTLDGDRLYAWPLAVDIVESDLVINVPVVKHHALTQVTVGLKNYMGVAGGQRYHFHTDLPSCLTDIAAFMKPRLSVVDAVRVLTNNGPAGGELTDVEIMGVVAAGTDIVALEAFGAELLGRDPFKGRTMALAEARGLGTVDYRSLNPRDIQLG